MSAFPPIPVELTLLHAKVTQLGELDEVATTTLSFKC